MDDVSAWRVVDRVVEEQRLGPAQARQQVGGQRLAGGREEAAHQRQTQLVGAVLEANYRLEEARVLIIIIMLEVYRLCVCEWEFVCWVCCDEVITCWAVTMPTPGMLSQ